MNESVPVLTSSSREKNKREKWFEEQFKNVETLDAGGRSLRVLDINPPDAKDEVPVVLTPGYGASSPEHVKVNIAEMVHQGRRTVYVDEPRGIDFGTDNEKLAEIEAFLLRQTEALIAALDKKNIAKTDVVGTSEGAMYAVVAANLYPERFRDLVLFDPGGMIGDDTLVRLCYRFLTEGVSELKRKKELMSPASQQQKKEGFAGFKKYLKEDFSLSKNEIRAMVKTQIRDLLKQAHERGVRISIVHSVDDKVFPMSRVQEQASRTPSEKEQDDNLIVDGFYSVKGGHGEFLLDPERFTRIADEALTALEKKRRGNMLSESNSGSV